MKTKLVLASAFLAASSISIGEIVVNEYLSFEGFIDMSYSHLDGSIDSSGSSNYDETENSFAIDEVEITWLFDFDPVTAQLDIEYEEGRNDLEVEQAFVTYLCDEGMNGSAIIVGRYASMLGFEDYEAPGLYQFSTAYGGLLSDLFGAALSGAPSFTFGSDESVFIESILFPVGERYSQGIKYSFEDDRTFVGVSIQDGTINYDNRLGGDSDEDGTAVDDGGYGFEAAYAYNFGNGLTYFLGGSYETGDGITTSTTTTGDTQTYVINTYGTLELGAWIFAAELNYSETAMDDIFGAGDDAEVESVTGLLMTNYAYNESSSVTGRISYMNLEGDINAPGGADIEGRAFRYTVAHNYAVTDNLLIITEFSYSDGKFDSATGADGDFEEILAAAEVMFTF